MKKALAWVIALLFCMAAPLNAFAQKSGGGELTYKPKGSKPVVFSHDIHVNDQGLKCTACHYHVFQMAKGTYRMEMAKITKGDFCGKCHNGQKSFDAKEKNNCSRCHKQSK